MAGYRFCRSDDVGLLVDAYNSCYRVHFPGKPKLTVDAFKRMARELNLWTSSCMLASVDGLPVGVLLAAKREGIANWIHSVGLHPDHQRAEHGKHMMTSLSAKLAILKPTRMLLEVPADATVARQFVEACGYQEDTLFTDFTRPATPGQGGMLEIIIPTTVEELVQHEAFDRKAKRCWARAPETLINLGETLDGLAIASGESIEAYVLFDDETDLEHRRIMAFHAPAANPTRAQRMLGLLLQACASTTERPLYLPRASPEEQALAGLEQLGFTASYQTVGYATEAVPG